MQFKEDPKNLIIPLDLTKIIYSEWDADLAILDRPDQVYGKALHGGGKVKFRNGNAYEGEFYNGMLHGKGKFTWSSGVIYEGDFTYNRITGIGAYQWPDGSKYEGSVENGLRHGDGTFIANGETAIYVGQWENGLRHGQGKVNFASGSHYQGQFINGNKQGPGKMVYPSQNFYEGNFELDKKCGYGTMNWLNSYEKYYGQWAENMQNGWGVHIWLEPKGEGSKFLRNRYEGQWENGERSGVGVFYYANGSKYLGKWSRNLKDGRAVFITESGGIIMGNFLNDRLKRVLSTTETEERSGILPREIAPTKEDQQEIQQESQKKNSKKQPTPPKKPLKSQAQSNAALVGLNSPNNTTGTVNTRAIESNPYSYMIDFSDLYKGGLNVNSQQIDENVQMILLRHNSTLRNWYKFFANKFESTLSEDTFSLNLEGFWRIARDAKLLNGNYTLAQLNRNFLQGYKNIYDLNTNEQSMLSFIEGLELYGEDLDLKDLNEMESVRIARQEKQEIDYNDLNSLCEGQGLEKINIHDGKRVVLFRHFVELLVRLCYLKWGNLTELHRGIERVIINKLTPYYERKKGKESQEDTKSANVLKSKINIEDYTDILMEIYNKFSSQVSNPIYGYVDNTMKFGDLIELINQSDIECDKQLLLSYLEKHFDPEEGSLNQQSQSIDQSSLNQTKNEKKRKQNANDSHADARDKKGQSQPQIEKWILCYHNELLFFEFADILISYLAKKVKDVLHPKEEEQRNRMTKVLEKLKGMEKKDQTKKQQNRIWPKSNKDSQKSQLKELRIQQEARAKQKKLNEEERKREERERNLMELEDQDVKSNYDEDEESQESDL